MAQEYTFKDAREKLLKLFELEHVNSGVFDGNWAPTDGKETITSVSPINGEVLAEVSMADAGDYERVMENMEKAFKSWSAIPAPKRGELIREIGDELIKYRDELGLLLSLEVGKTLTEGQGEIQEVVDISNFAVGLSRQIYGPTIASERVEHRLYEQWKPLGIVGVITAFNFPAAVWGWNAAIASIIGDTVVWKPSSKAPLTAIAMLKVINKIFKKKGMESIFGMMVGRGSVVGNRFTDDRRLPLVSFTGSIPTGRVISERVGKRLGRTILELGGNNGAIVTGNADVDNAIKGVAFGALATAGQRCTSTRRLILHESIYDEFLDKLKTAYAGVSVGNPLNPNVLVGPLIDENAVVEFERALENAESEGGKTIIGGKRRIVNGVENGYYVDPTIVEVTPDNSMVKEETFAPILYVMKYRSIDDALNIHNQVTQGLSSSIFTKDLREAELFLSYRGSDCGIANVNTSTAGAEIGGAFGGEKDTGGGRESGSDAWKAYGRRQTVTINYGEDVPLAQGVKFDV